MRELTDIEMKKVAGGHHGGAHSLLKAQPLPPVLVTAPYPGGGGDGGGGNDDDPPNGSGGGSGGGGSTGGGLSSGTKAGIARIKKEMGIDLTAYAQESPTLSSEIDRDVNSESWHFAFHKGSSDCAYAAVPTTDNFGTIYINQAYATDPDAVVQQLAHELGHVDHQVFDNPEKVSLQ